MGFIFVTMKVSCFIFLLLIGFGSTFVRFIPYIKKNYDYGVIIFLLTFTLITLSTLNEGNTIDVARNRLYMILIGTAIVLVITVLILPNWSGQDLERSTVKKLEALANSIEGKLSQILNWPNSIVSEIKLSQKILISAECVIYQDLQLLWMIILMTGKSEMRRNH